MCVGSESQYFNGYSNITDDKLLCFGVKGLLDTNKGSKTQCCLISFPICLTSSLYKETQLQVLMNFISSLPIWQPLSISVEDEVLKSENADEEPVSNLFEYEKNRKHKGRIKKYNRSLLYIYWIKLN